MARDGTRPKTPKRKLDFLTVTPEVAWNHVRSEVPRARGEWDD